MLRKSQKEIMQSWGDPNGEPVVSINCMAFNHEAYIEQALDGFLSQITNFPFEVVVHDDASTDHTADVIKKYEERYPLIVKPIYESTNQYSKQDGTLRRIVYSHMSGKYIATCEGDDYWVDQYKLQKQVDFLEANHEYVMCFTNFDFYYQRKNKFERNMLTEKPSEFPHHFTLVEWIENPSYVGFMTWVVRREVMNSYQYIKTSDGSFAQFAHFLSQGKVKCMTNETTAVYRVLSESASHSTNIEKQYKRQKSLCDTKILLAEKYDLGDDVKRRILYTYYNTCYKLICLQNEKDEKKKALKYCKKRYQHLIIIMSSVILIRKIMCVMYKWKHR